jgi:hypothetical protein
VTTSPYYPQPSHAERFNRNLSQYSPLIYTWSPRWPVSKAELKCKSQISII